MTFRASGEHAVANSHDYADSSALEVGSLTILKASRRVRQYLRHVGGEKSLQPSIAFAGGAT